MLSDKERQNLGAEMNISETAFIVPQDRQDFRTCELNKLCNELLKNYLFFYYDLSIANLIDCWLARVNQEYLQIAGLPAFSEVLKIHI